MKRRWSVALTLALALALVAGACGGGSKSSDTPASSNAEKPSLGALTQVAGQANASSAPVTANKVKRGGTLTIGMEANPKDFDPMMAGDSYSQDVTSAVTEGLYKYNEKVEPTPWLAEKIDQPDPVTYVFHLRQGVKFHDGTEMDAEAVKFSVDRVRNNPKSPGYGDGKLVQDTVVVDKYTFKLVLTEVSSPFPSRLTGRLGGIVSPTAVKAMGDEKFNQSPVGTGPFKFGEFKSDNYVRVEKFDGYWRKDKDGQQLPYLDRVEWRIILEPAARLTALQSGDILVPGVTSAGIRDQDAKIVKEDKSLRYEQQAGFSYTGFPLAIDKPPFDNKALRQALAYAIDRDEIVKAIYEGNRIVGNGPIPLTLDWAIDKSYVPYTYDPAKAKAKLAEGGKPNGYDFTIQVASGSSVSQQLFELIQAQVKKVGINMNIEYADFNGVVVKNWMAINGQAFSISWSTGIDPDQGMTNQFTKDGSFNHFPYDNPKVTELVTAARKTSSLEERGKLYKQAVPLIMDDSPYIFLVYGIDRWAASKKVQGWYLGQKATTSYSEFWIDQ